MPQRMFEGHQLWLENLKACAEGGAPPSWRSPHDLLKIVR